MSDETIQAGDNFLKGLDPTRLMFVTVEQIDPLLTLQYKPLMDRGEELLARATEWAKEHHVAGEGHVIADDVAMNHASDLFAQLYDYASDKGEVEEARKKVNEQPRLAVGAINAWFGNRRDRLVGAMAVITAAQKRRLEAVKAAEEAERRRVAREAQDRADALAAAARAAEATPEVIDAAMEAEMQAEEAKIAGSAPMQEMTRTRSAMGVTTSGSETWTYELVDMLALVRAVAAGKLPINFLTVNDVILRTSIRQKAAPLRECAGLRIYPETKINRRGGK